MGVTPTICICVILLGLLIIGNVCVGEWVVGGKPKQKDRYIELYEDNKPIHEAVLKQLDKDNTDLIIKYKVNLELIREASKGFGGSDGTDTLVIDPPCYLDGCPIHSERE